MKSNFEKKTALYLEHGGYEVFLPLYESSRHWSDRTKIVRLPVFPGYLFCRMDVTKRGPIAMAPGVISIVGVGRSPIPVEEQEIAAIQSVLREGLLIKPWPFLQIGQRVLIEAGSFSGVEGILVKEKANYRIVLSVTLLQRSVAVEINRDWVRPISSKARLIA